MNSVSVRYKLCSIKHRDTIDFATQMTVRAILLSCAILCSIPQWIEPVLQPNGFFANRRGCPHRVCHFNRVRRSVV